MDKRRIMDILIDQQHLLDVDENFVSRDIDIDRYLSSREIIVISGIRRCGKSTLLKMVSRKFSGRKILIDFSDIRFNNFSVDDYTKLDECILEVYDDVDLFLLDEVQNAPLWQRWVNGIHSRGKKVLLTGSNSDLLSSEISTFLTGRNRVIALAPFSFREFLTFKGRTIQNIDHVGTNEKVEFLKLFDEYSSMGGFPEVLNQNDVDLARYYFNDIITKDIVARYGIREANQIKELALFLVSNVGCSVSYKKMMSLTGIKSLSTVKIFLDHLEESFLFGRIRRYSHSLRKQRAYPYKVYACDTGFVTSTAFRVSENTGHILENVVYNHLERKGNEIFYHLEKKECDFVVRKGRKVSEVFQVCESLSGLSTREREIDGLLDAMREYDLDHGTIITRDEKEEEFNVDGYSITVVPAWKWLLK